MENENRENVQYLEEKLNRTMSELQQIKELLLKKGISLNESDELKYDQLPESNGFHEVMKSKLTHSDILRYSRQLILPEIGVEGQLKLSNSSVLIVGAGGLGCPVAVYLAAAGVGHIGLVDYDDVEISNLHRQVLHSELKVNWSKVDSARQALSQLNSSLKIQTYKIHLNSNNAMDMISNYNIIVDATDNVPTRYLLNDTCILSGKPLVSGSALRFDGQLTIYGYQNGPCYRCLYPNPPPPAAVGNCSDVGVLGVVPGIIGNLQALEVIKMAAGLPVSFNQKLLLFDALDGKFTTIKLRGRQKNCVICGEKPSITTLQDYEQFCGQKASDKGKNIRVLDCSERLSVQEYKKLIDDSVDHLLIDVRPTNELEICQLSTSRHFINLPIRDIEGVGLRKKITDDIVSLLTQINCKNRPIPIVAVCRYGNDSQRAVVILKKILLHLEVTVKDIFGGLDKWSEEIDPSFPREYKKLIDDSVDHLLIDVRPTNELEICQLSTSRHFINLPIRDIEGVGLRKKITDDIVSLLTQINCKNRPIPIVAVCRYGNDSQRAVVILKKILLHLEVTVKDIFGGLDKWSEEIDPSFPRY
ncbi:adenylyltransferase and sulfurtransferase MOCS3-like [Xenia sp. Carnegie-2017]|uniref:adenylyltransferase and sulfurtransferase MOCS3-like n=1 Tax=Xenia sp. Carnegie-2017 TaxID=2897299 RepID=UPI001F040D0C|nr:adenylyltransferase and sulfurtransferase MOCS3-like [Xenia sp. Carnegie-2017]